MTCRCMFIILILSSHSLMSISALPETQHDEAIDILASLDPYIPVPFPLEDWCTAWLHRFAIVSSAFIECSVRHARPFRFCRNCLQQYIEAHNFISDLINEDEKVKADKRCFPTLVNSDIINIVGKVREFMEDVWRDSACNSCFDHYTFDNGTIHATLTNMTKQYIAQYNITYDCLTSYITYDNQTKHFDQFACAKCNDDYVELNNIYSGMKSNGSVCMDVTDAMNYTRYLWSKDFQCNISDPNEAVVVGTCCAIFTLPVIFYLTVRFQSSVRRKKLLKLKRLNLRKGPSHARLLQSASLVYSDQLHINRGTGERDDYRRLDLSPDEDEDGVRRDTDSLVNC